MPTRLLRDCTDSEPVNALSVHGERHFYRLIMKADDYGRLTGNPKLLRAQLYPLLLETVREADLQRWTAECEKSGLVRLYETAGKQCIEIVNFGQRIRAETSKFPDPPGNDGQVTGTCPTPAGHPRPYAETKAHAKAEAEVPVGFVAFWDEWPPHDRKDSKKQCLAHWRSNDLEAKAGLILECLRAWKASEQWAKDGGRWIPGPHPWLNKKKWEANFPPPAAANGHAPANPKRDAVMAALKTRRSHGP